MTALTDSRDTTRRYATTFEDPVAADTVIQAGSLVCLNSTGYAVPGSTATTLIARGRAEEKADNTDGADGDITVTITTGVYHWGNLTGDLVTRAEIGKNCYVTDDQTVCKTATGKSVAGTVVDLDAEGVWVKTGAF